MDEGPMIAMMVQSHITPTLTDTLYIFDRSDPRDLAIRFSAKHNLSGRALLLLVNNISETQAAAKKQVRDSLETVQKFHPPETTQARVPTSFADLLDHNHRPSLKPQIQELIQDNHKLRLQTTKLISHQNANLAFHPKINNNSRNIIQTKRESVHSSKVFERLYGHVNYNHKSQKAVLQKGLKQQYIRNRSESSAKKEVPHRKQQSLHQPQRRSQPVASQSRLPTPQFSYEPVRLSTPEAFPLKQPLRPTNSDQQPRQNSNFTDSQLEDKDVYEIWRHQMLKLFKLLDSDKDGLISTNEINFTQVNPRAQGIIGLILCNMLPNTQYNFDDFFEIVTLRCVDEDLTLPLMEALGNQQPVRSYTPY